MNVHTEIWFSLFEYICLWRSIELILVCRKPEEKPKKKRKGPQLAKNKLSFDFDEEPPLDEESSSEVSSPPLKKTRTDDNSVSNTNDQNNDSKEEKSEEDSKSESKSESKGGSNKTSDKPTNFIDLSKAKIRKDPTVDTSFLPGIHTKHTKHTLNTKH
jgi:hypothetical protein